MLSPKLLLALASVVVAAPALADCGPFGVFKDNDYCISCSGRTFKENSCPGGEVGLAAEGVLHPGCNVSYYSPDSCRVNSLMSRKLMAELKRKGHLASTYATPAQQSRWNAKNAK